MINTGKGYESFVAVLQKAIIDSEEIAVHKNIVVEKNKKLIDTNGNEREFDIYWEYELGGLIYKTVIECKDHNSKISIEKIDAFIGKGKDIPDLKLVFASKKGYQSGAKKKAEFNRIDLLIIREQNDTDWEDEHGNPLIKNIEINIIAQSPAKIKNFVPKINKEWVIANTSLDLTQPLIFIGNEDELIIDDLSNSTKYSLYDLRDRLKSLGDSQFGEFSMKVMFDNAFICNSDFRLKLDEYDINYEISEPIKSKIVIDYSKELNGVVEYITKKKKKLVYLDGRD